MVNLSIFRAVLPSLSVFRQGLGAGVCLWVLGGILQVGPIQAHSLGESYLVLSVYEDSLRGQVEVTLSDLDKALGLDRDGDGKISAGEIEGQIEVAKAYVAANTALDAYQVQFVDWELVEVPLGRFAAFKFAVDLVEPPPPVLDIEFKLLFERDPQHRGFLVVEYNYVTGAVNKSEEISAIFTPSAPRQQLVLAGTSLWGILYSFVGQGIWHIWIGIDHILFLMAFILQAVMVRQKDGWKPADGFRPALLNVVKIISLFTLAHSITLSLAVLELVSLPPRLIESVIAASVVLAAINNIYPLFGDRVWWVIFGFGLFHGFGFATVLTHLGLSQSSLALSLLGFNLGVEIGQVAIILLAFPLFFLLRAQLIYQRIFLRVGSVAIGFVATLWLIERAFDLQPLVPFL